MGSGDPKLSEDADDEDDEDVPGKFKTIFKVTTGKNVIELLW